MVKKKIKNLLRAKVSFCCSLAFLITPSLQGAEAEIESFRQNPFESVDKMTAQLLDIIEIYKSDYPDNEDAYFASLNQLMGDFVDFNFVARRVMGKYHSNIASEFVSVLEHIVGKQENIEAISIFPDDDVEKNVRLEVLGRTTT